MTAKAACPSLRGRTALLMGGASGIGAAIVRGFARTGTNVPFLDIDRAAGDALAAELGDALFLDCDPTDPTSARSSS